MIEEEEEIKESIIPKIQIPPTSIPPLSFGVN